MDLIERTIKTDGYNSQFRSLAIDQVGYESCKENHSFGPAIRDHYLFHYIVDGCGTYTIDGQTYTLSKGMIFMISPDILTEYKADGHEPWTYYWIGFSGLEAKELVKLTGFSKHRYIMEYSDTELGMEKSLKGLIHKLAVKRISEESDKLEEISSLYKVLSLLRKNYEVSPFIKEEKVAINSHVRTAVDYILKNYTFPITIDNIATYVGIDRTQLYRLFEETYNIGPKEYIIKLRLKKAGELLINTDLAIKNISFSVGYNDQYLFSKIFKKYYGFSPKIYREQSLS